MVEKIFDGDDALLGESFRDLRANAFNELNGGVKLNHIAMLAGDWPSRQRRFARFVPVQDLQGSAQHPLTASSLPSC